MSYSPNQRYGSTLKTMGQAFGGIDAEGYYNPAPQAKGHGGFMLDASIGKSIYIGRKSLSINLMVTNILNNQKIVSGGYEYGRSSYTVNKATGAIKDRAYDFGKNPKLYYVYGINGMLNIAYKF